MREKDKKEKLDTLSFKGQETYTVYVTLLVLGLNNRSPFSAKKRIVPSTYQRELQIVSYVHS